MVSVLTRAFLVLGRAGKAGTTCLRLNRSQFVSLVLLFRSDEVRLQPSYRMPRPSEAPAFSPT
eukprot:1057123-Rhodomonas_salina.1